MSCASPILAALLADYWLGLLDSGEEGAVEEHLFACEDCGARLRQMIALAEGIRKLARSGSLRMIVSDKLLERAAAEGLRVREYAPQRGGSVECTVTAEDDILIGRLAADLRTAKQVDLRIYDLHGAERVCMTDIPFDSTAGTVAFQESITYAKAAASETIVARLFAFDEAGNEELLGEYTFHHRRTLPGPGRRVG